MQRVRVISNGSMVHRSITTVGHRLNQTEKRHKTASKLQAQHKNSLTLHAPLVQRSSVPVLVCTRFFIFFRELFVKSYGPFTSAFFSTILKYK